jgi:hypothetical protein
MRFLPERLDVMSSQLESAIGARMLRADAGSLTGFPSPPRFARTGFSRRQSLSRACSLSSLGWKADDAEMRLAGVALPQKKTHRSFRVAKLPEDRSIFELAGRPMPALVWVAEPERFSVVRCDFDCIPHEGVFVESKGSRSRPRCLPRAKADNWGRDPFRHLGRHRIRQVGQSGDPNRG